MALYMCPKHGREHTVTDVYEDEVRKIITMSCGYSVIKIKEQETSNSDQAK